MINSVGQALSSAIEASKLREGGKARSAVAIDAGLSSEGAESIASPAARMAAEGAPVDLDRVAAIRAAIASGSYPVDASAIAERMLALDLPARG